MQAPRPLDMLQRVRALPAAPPLLASAGDNAGVHLVGGAVRDLLLGGTPLDLDVVVEGDVGAVTSALGGEIQIHDRFGTATVRRDGYVYDFSRSRRETYATPGALPDVEPAPIDVDLQRRDFAVNTLAVQLGGDRAGELRAVAGALDDLGARRLRVLHDASFIDDPTRLLRLARYWARLSFDVEPHTLELAGAAIGGGALRTISGPRVGAELRLLAREPDPLAAMARLRELGLDEAIAPGFTLDDAALASDALALLPPDGRRDLLVLAVAAGGVAPEELARVLDAMAFEATERDAILAAATRADSVAVAMTRAARPSEIADAAAGAGPELVALAGATGPAQPARDWLERLRHVQLEIDGRDLLAAGVPEGPAIGRALKAALAAKLDGGAGSREQELEQALSAAR
jgi:tRNA nucleotidyltransferase (CCA-adding enzyme)